MELEPPSETRVLNDRYEVLRPLGHGGMGEVHLVYDRQEEREVALKAFPPDARRVEDLAHFEHEFLTLSRLQHPNVAAVYDFGVIEGKSDVFFTSEFIDGQDLFSVSDGLPEEELVRLLVQVCRGLEYIHSRGIIHYDVKPTNVLVTETPDGEPLVKLIDFGLAAERVDESLGVIKGTVSYLAPEVARHLPVDRRADLYSLGATVFHCVTRRLPFKGETNLDVVRRVVSDPTPDPRELSADLSDGLAEVVLRLMAKDPGARYQTGNALIRALGSVYAEDYAIEPRDVMLPFVASGGFFGRERETRALTGAFDAVFAWREGVAAGGAAADGDEESAGPGSTTGFVLSSSGDLHLSLDSEPASPSPTEASPKSEPRPPTEGRASPLREAPSTFTAGFDESTGGAAASDAALAPAGDDGAAPDAAGPLEHLFLVTGEVGVGKSRLLAEFKTYAQLRRVAVVEGRPSPTGRAYDAFVQVFRGILGLWHRDPDESASAEPLRPRQNDPLRRRLLQRYGAELVRLIPELDASFLPVSQRANLAPDQEEVRLLDALAQFLIGYSRSRPLVVLLHDLEDADVQTLELLEYLARNLQLIESTRALARRTPGMEPPRALRLQVVASYRTSEVAAPQREVLERLSASPVTTSLPLEPLGPEQVYTLIESMLGAGTEPRALAQRIYEEAKGNPYFTVELMRSLVETDRLVFEDGEWTARLDDDGGLSLPENVTEVILSRVRRTSAEERRPLHLLSVLGRPASIHELAALAGEDARELVGVLDGLVKRQVLHLEVEADGGRRYDFINDVARAAIYEDVPVEERISLHAACGDYLEARAGVSPSTVDMGELVRHFTAAGDRARALEYGIRAGDEARAVHANHRAIELYGGALALLPTGSARWRDLLQRTGDLLALTGDYGRAVEVYDRILSPEVASRLAPFERVRAHRRRGEVLAKRGDLDAALEALSQGATVAMGADGLEREAAALFAATASIYNRMGRYQDAIGFCDVGLQQLIGTPEGDEAAEVHTVLGRARLALGEPVAAEKEFERCLAIRRVQGDEAGVARTLADLGEVALDRGRPEDAADRFERALERETALGHVAGLAEAARRLARACRGLGEHERAVSLLRRSLSIHEKTGAAVEAVQALTDLARAYLSVGQYQAALEHVRRARGESERLELLAEAARAMNAEAELLLSLGDLSAAARVATEALRRASLHGDVPRQRARSLETLGKIETARDHLDRAEQLLHEAQALLRAQKDRAGVVRTTLAVLEIFLARGDAELARATLSTLREEEETTHIDQARIRYVRVRVAVAFDEELPGGLLGDLERASAWAEKYADRELAWRVAAVRGRLLVRLGEDESALNAYVEAMTAIRDLRDRVPEELRRHYVQKPEALACKREFSALRDRIMD